MNVSERVFMVGSGRFGHNQTNDYDCNIYLVDGGSEQMLVDTGSGLAAQAICNNIAADGFDLSGIRYILVTHGHGDHALGTYALQQRTGAKIVCSRLTAPILRNADEEANNLRLARELGRYPAHCKLIPCTADLEVGEHEGWTVGDLTFEAVTTPGHSFDMISVYCPELNGLFSSDVVFEGGRIVKIQGNYDFSMKDLYASMKKLTSFSAENLYTGHFNPLIGNGTEALLQAIEKFDRGQEPESIL